MKKILFPTDFSKAAANALNVAISLAQRVNAELFVLHSLNSVQQYVDISLASSGDITMPGMQPEIILEAIQKEKDRVKKQMDDLVTDVSDKGFPVHTFIVDSELDREINEFTVKYNIDFIVMGTFGSSGLRETFIGSNAQKIVRKAKVPVLTVNANCANFNIRKVVLSSDFTEDIINEQLPRVKDFADVFMAELTLLYVNTPNYFEETNTVTQRINDVRDAYGLTAASISIYNSFDIDEGVISYAEQNDADVIAMVTHGYRGVKKLFSDNITESVVNHSNIPVLTLHIN
ncbi:MAG: nucleotide-binding universal stress UspA family protein [Salibacteraceae bacterium]|jgi:nucleotide-binding universal stress UspA family protein